MEYPRKGAPHPERQPVALGAPLGRRGAPANLVWSFATSTRAREGQFAFGCIGLCCMWVAIARTGTVLVSTQYARAYITHLGMPRRTRVP
jgi:hypothetical protein